MRKNDLVSVVVANYNMGKYLPYAIQSILEQTYPYFDIHIVDDGSTDNSRDVISQYENDSRIFIHYQENQGQAKAKNTGILSAKGSFIAFLDADDTWSHDKLEKQLPWFERKNNIGVVYTSYALTTEDGRLMETPKRKHYNGKITEKLLIDNFVTGMASIVKKECFDAVGIFDETLPMGIDYDLWLRISARYEFYYIDDVTYYYRQWGGQMSHRHTKRFECAVRIMQKFIDEHPGCIRKSKIDEAWAHLYVSQGYNCFIKENKNISSLSYFIRALLYKWNYKEAWKAIIKVLINRKI